MPRKPPVVSRSVHGDHEQPRANAAGRVVVVKALMDGQENLLRDVSQIGGVDSEIAQRTPHVWELGVEKVAKHRRARVGVHWEWLRGCGGLAILRRCGARGIRHGHFAPTSIAPVPWSGDDLQTLASSISK